MINNFKPIKTALIGFGFSGQTFHVPFLKMLSAFEVTHVVGSQVEIIQKIFSKKSVTIFDRKDVHKIFTDPSIDLVIITAPNRDHYSLAKEALLHKKHVVIEKPFVLCSKEGLGLIDLAKFQNVLLTVYHNRRFDSDFLTVQKLLKEKLLGDIYLFKARYDRYRPLVNASRWKESSGPGTGTLWDLGVHLIDQMLVLFGKPNSVFADAISQRPGSQAIDYFDLYFSYNYGFRAHLSSISLVVSSGPKYEIHGNLGSFIKQGGDPQEAQLIEGMSPLSAEFGLESEVQHGTVYLQNQCKIYPSELGRYKSFFINLADCIQKGSQSIIFPSQALSTIEIIQACYESHTTRKEIGII